MLVNTLFPDCGVEEDSFYLIEVTHCGRLQERRFIFVTKSRIGKIHLT